MQFVSFITQVEHFSTQYTNINTFSTCFRSRQYFGQYVPPLSLPTRTVHLHPTKACSCRNHRLHFKCHPRSKGIGQYYLDYKHPFPYLFIEFKTILSRKTTAMVICPNALNNLCLHCPERCCL